MTNLLCYLSYFLMIFLSGATMPDMLFPESVRSIANLLPMTYAVDLMQGTFRGNPLTDYMTELVVLFGVTLFFTMIGAMILCIIGLVLAISNHIFSALFLPQILSSLGV